MTSVISPELLLSSVNIPSIGTSESKNNRTLDS